MLDFNKDGKIDWRDVAIVTTAITTLFNVFLNILTTLGLGISLTSNDVPVMDCRPYNVEGRAVIRCYRKNPPSLSAPPLYPEPNTNQ